MDFTWFGNQISSWWYLKKKSRGVDQNTSPYLVWSPFASCSATSPSNIVDQAVDCGLWSVVPLLFNDCKVSGHWRELAVVHIEPEHPEHAQRVTCLVSMQTMEELGHFQLPGIVCRSLRHGAVHYHAETCWWQINGTIMGLRISSQYLCNPIANDKMQLCSLSVVYAWQIL